MILGRGNFPSLSTPGWLINFSSLKGYIYGVANVLDCNNLVGEFEFLSSFYVYFRTNTYGKGMKPLIPSIMG